MNKEFVNPLAEADANVRRAKKILQEAEDLGEPEERLASLRRLVDIAEDDLQRVTSDRSVN